MMKSSYIVMWDIERLGQAWRPDIIASFFSNVSLIYY